MKSLSEMNRLEFASFISSALVKEGIDAVLSGGSCVSIYSEDKYVSMDLDFIPSVSTKREKIIHVMQSLGFSQKNRYFIHAGCELIVEFPPGPLAVGEEPVKRVDEINTDFGTLRIISPTDCVKDRLTWFFHDDDLECLEQAVLVASAKEVDLKEVKRWAKNEGSVKKFKVFKELLKNG